MTRVKILTIATFGFLVMENAFFSAVGLSQETVNPGTTGQTPEGAAPRAEEKPGFVTMDFKEADINTVLRLLSLKSGVNIVAGPEVKGTVTVRLENVPWEQALDVVLRTYGYVYERVGNIIRVTTRDNLGQEEVITETFILDYTTAVEVQEAVKDMLTERGKIKVAARTNTVVISDIPTNVYKVGEVIKKLDRSTPQAYIDSRIVKTQLDKGENLGIKWNPADLGIKSGATRPHTFPFSTPSLVSQEGTSTIFGGRLQQFFPAVAGSTTTSGTSAVSTATANTADTREFPFPNPVIENQTFQFGRLDFSAFSALLSFLQSRSNTKVVSNPRIVVLNNQTAKVKVGSEIPIPSFRFNEKTATYELDKFSYRDVGVVLNVTPHINSANEILVDLKPEVSAQGATISFTSTLAAPSFTVTSAETQVLIRSGETIAIGGLMEDKYSISEAQIPYLSSIPVVGKIFRSKRQTEGSSNTKVETLFFVTVTVVDTEGQPVGKRTRYIAAPLPSKDTVGTQSVVKPPDANFSPTKAG